jgi:hypothetical protein
VIPRHLLISLSLLLAAALCMGLYAWHMRGRAAATPVASADAQPVVAPVAGPTERVTLWVAYDDIGTLRAQSAQIPMNSPHPLPPGSQIRGVYLIDPGLAVIDVNAAMADGHRSGILAEDLTVASLVQTIAANIPGILKVKLLVEGKQRDTLAGHADLSNFFDVSAIGQLTSELQSTP